jgi:hypothetical protein
MSHLKIVKPSHALSAEDMNRHIEQSAYYKWLERGGFSGVSQEIHDWLEAEKEIEARLKTQGSI